jgi:hypothetical protein
MSLIWPLVVAWKRLLTMNILQLSCLRCRLATVSEIHIAAYLA